MKTQTQARSLQFLNPVPQPHLPNSGTLPMDPYLAGPGGSRTEENIGLLPYFKKIKRGEQAINVMDWFLGHNKMASHQMNCFPLLPTQKKNIMKESGWLGPGLGASFPLDVFQQFSNLCCVQLLSVHLNQLKNFKG